MRRDTIFAWLTTAIARVLLPVAVLRHGRRGRHVAAQWALGLRFPHEELRGLTPAAHAAFTSARTEALWRDRQLIGLSSGHRDAAVQWRMFLDEVARTGAESVARLRVLPPDESAHVTGIAMDVRPAEGARWLEAHGWRFGLYRRYDNEWWHFEYWPVAPPPRLPNPAVSRPHPAPGPRPTAWR
ncbi:MAG: D-alanyl-D-alanine carboxypeptidase [Actinophytocola sp.]|uniref:D-alanyl-D-alanine carboxypeptidase n=1 Tax=Actinophytocola sp. TaxID=1872138 RepID=UPI003C785E46